MDDIDKRRFGFHPIEFVQGLFVGAIVAGVAVPILLVAALVLLLLVVDRLQTWNVI